MKKSLLAVAVAAALPAAAFAQTNVTLYGIMDVGVGMNDTDGPGADAAMVVNSGYQSTSRLGVRGSEDLGGGLKAIFNLEMGNRPDEGISDSDIAGRSLWQRRAVVGLAGGFGEVRVGRDYTVGFSAAGQTDALGYGLFGNWLNFTAGAGGITTRASNGIWYTSPAFGNTKCMAGIAPDCPAFGGGLTFTAFYATGETNDAAAGPMAGDADANDAYGLAVVYKGGPLILQGYYQELNDAAGDAKKEYGLGGGWNFGTFRLTASYGLTEAPNGIETEGIGFGGGIKIGAGELMAQYIQITRDAATAGGLEPEAAIWGIGYVYPLSKRTNLYATYGMTDNDNTASSFGNLSSDNSVAAGAAGASPKAFAVGVRHMF